MTNRPLYLIDRNATKVAGLDVGYKDGRFEGSICLDSTPTPLRELFEQFEEIVEGQMFSLLDGIEEKIAADSLRAIFEDGKVAAVTDLQVFPRTRAVSFSIEQPVVTR